MRKSNEGNDINKDTGESFYLALELADAAREELISVAADLHRLDQRSTEQVFRKGELLESAAKLLPDTTIEKWARSLAGTRVAVFGRIAQFTGISTLTSANSWTLRSARPYLEN